MNEFLYRAQPWFITFVQHNWPVLICVALGLVAAVWTYLRPSRRTVLVLYGILGLAFAYEYQKHLVPALLDTVRYLFSVETNPGPRAVSQVVIARVLPTAFALVSVAMLAAASAPWCWRAPRSRSGENAPLAIMNRRPRRTEGSTTGTRSGEQT